MKIKFLIGNEIATAEVTTWKEVVEFRDNGHIVPSRNFFDVLKKLERNKDFEDKVLKAREAIGLPKKGISWQTYYLDYYMNSLGDYSEEGSKKYQDFFSKIENEVNRIKGEMDFEQLVLNQLNYLIIGSFVYPDGFPITHQVYPLEPEPETYTSVIIHIRNKVTKHALHEYIEENWIGLNRLLKDLPEEKNTIASERDLRIVYLKKSEKHSFREIAKNINADTRFNQNGKKNSVGAIKSAYYRTIKAIEYTAKTIK